MSKNHYTIRILPMGGFMSSLKIAKSFLKGHQIAFCGEWNVNYMFFDGPAQCERPPIIFLGGAFQKFSSFKKDVEYFTKYSSVYLVDLPGQGGNEQSAEGLSFSDLSDILHLFVSEKKLEKVTLVALSYGSAIGYQFASSYPNSIAKLILGGTTEKLRDSVRYLLEESLVSLAEGRMEDFSAGVVLNLLNFSRRSEIPGGEILIKSLYKNMKKLSGEDCRRYIENTKRLLALDSLTGHPICETLVVAGEYDNFTTPFECFKVAKRAPNSCFAIIKGVDHLGPYQKKELVNRVYLDFLEGERLQSGNECEVYRSDSYPRSLRQIEPRFNYKTWASLQSKVHGISVPIKIVDINQFGCCIEGESLTESLIGRMDLTLKLPWDEVEMEGIIFMKDENLFRVIFKRYDFEQGLKTERFIQDIVDSEECCLAA